MHVLNKLLVIDYVWRGTARSAAYICDIQIVLVYTFVRGLQYGRSCDYREQVTIIAYYSLL